MFSLSGLIFFVELPCSFEAFRLDRVFGFGASFLGTGPMAQVHVCVVVAHLT